MPEWWTYSLSDLQAFTLETYYRLFERYNAAIWPAQIAAVAIGLSIPLLLRRPGLRTGRLVAAILAACWVWVAIGFHASRYAEIHRAAVYFGWGFGLEALLLVGSGVLGGRTGDVYVRVRVRPDPRFVREGDDIFSTVDLTMTQAALGARVTIPTLNGETELEFDPGTQPGEVVVLRGRGMPVLQGFGRGDQRVLVNVAVPRKLTDEQRELLGQFERTAGEDTYRPDEGFFDKLKSAFR